MTSAQDIRAEQSVLGAMLLSKAAIASVIETVRTDDFYRRSHQAIFDSILFLHRRDQPADPVTVTMELEDRGDLARVGGAPYLHTLISIVPTAGDAAQYAELVLANAAARRRAGAA